LESSQNDTTRFFGGQTTETGRNPSQNLVDHVQKVSVVVASAFATATADFV
jgi:hypothetical protein